MKPGRNDPCPCGSGKKYKKCCLASDEAAARAEHHAAPPANPPPGSPTRWLDPLLAPSESVLDPAVAAIEMRWKEWERADYEERIGLFAVSMADPGMMSGDMAFEMLSDLSDAMAKRGERGRLDDLVEALREHVPDAYAEEAHFFLFWRIENALADGRTDALPPLVREMAALAHREFDLFDEIVDLLSYHGQLSLLVEAMETAWPTVCESDALTAWGVEQFGLQIANLLLLDALERESAASAAALLERMQTYAPITLEKLAPYLAHLTGQSERSWTQSDFQLAHRPPHEEDDEDMEGERPESLAEFFSDPARENLFLLSGEFLGYLHREEGVSFAKGEMVREEIVRYVVDRFEGELGVAPSPKRRPRGKEAAPAAPAPSVLCPDAATLETFLRTLMGFLLGEPWRAAATFELMPAWLRFLESRGLIDSEQRQQTVQVLARIARWLRGMWRRDPAEPILVAAMDRWLADAGME